MERTPEPIDVVLLSSPECELCEHAKEVLRRVSAEHPLEVSVVSLESGEGRELASLHQVFFPPGLLIGAELFSYGRVSERKLRRALSRQEANTERRQSARLGERASEEGKHGTL